ncbi:MAG: HAMP domain-containing sensor histidine kinase, partial [Parcubacteria group bacterium]
MKIVNDFNLKKQADELGIRIWQTPGALFIIMGFVAMIIMAATYFVSKSYDNPQVLVASECLVVMIVFSTGTSISRFVGQMANLNRMKSEFVAVASHQLRTPLSAIRWETELLLTKLNKDLNQNQIEKMKNISKLSLRMTRLVNDLLDVARIDQDRLILRKKSFDLAKLTRDILDEIIPAYSSRHISVSSDMEKDLPNALGDPEKVKLVLDNLIGNAFKYITSGGKVEIRIFQKKKNVIFEVKDNGVGIPEE